MSKIFSEPVLVLNKSWTPVQTFALKRAIGMLFTDKARIIDPSMDFQTFSWEDWSKLKPLADERVIRGANIWFRVPEIILLSEYDKIPQPKGQFSRRNLYKRDKLTCQYCGSQPGPAELTVDHVVPRSQGGTTCWENVALACVTCNSKKANRTPEAAGMRLRSVPKKPRVNLLHGLTRPVKSWQAFLGEAYWNVELESD